ncbi:MAG: hypothetical protein ABIB71_09425 [Candidatus Woesearchaeota archaeon]
MEGPSSLTVIVYLAAYFALFFVAAYLLRDRKVFGRSLREYLWPIWVYLLLAMFGVAWQYVGFFRGPSIGQALWAAMVALSIAVLLRKHAFKAKNVLFLAVLYSLMLHGAKCSLRYIVYGRYDMHFKTLAYIGSRFSYGAALVFFAAVFTLLALLLHAEASLKEPATKRMLDFALGLGLCVIALLIAIKIYSPGRHTSMYIWIIFIFAIPVATALWLAVRRLKKK